MKKILKKHPIRRQSVAKKSVITPKGKMPQGDFSSLRSELVISLKHLRLQTRDIAQNWSTKLQSEIAQSIEDINSIPAGSKKQNVQKHIPILQKINTAVQNLRLKSEKGRIKDLKHLHELVKTIRRLSDSLD